MSSTCDVHAAPRTPCTADGHIIRRPAGLPGELLRELTGGLPGELLRELTGELPDELLRELTGELPDELPD